MRRSSTSKPEGDLEPPCQSADARLDAVLVVFVVLPAMRGPARMRAGRRARGAHRLRNSLLVPAGHGKLSSAFPKYSSGLASRSPRPTQTPDASSARIPFLSRRGTRRLYPCLPRHPGVTRVPSRTPRFSRALHQSRDLRAPRAAHDDSAFITSPRRPPCHRTHLHSYARIEAGGRMFRKASSRGGDREGPAPPRFAPARRAPTPPRSASRGRPSLPL